MTNKSEIGMENNSETTEEKLAEGFVKGVFEIVELKKQNAKLQEMFDILATENMLEVNKLCNERDEAREQNEKLKEMFDMQVKLVTALELEKMELRNIIESLTKGKLPCNPDHNGECLVCDNWMVNCPLAKK